MSYQEALIAGLRRQREILEHLMHQISEEKDLRKVSRTYDAATRQIERNLSELRKTFFDDAASRSNNERN